MTALMKKNIAGFITFTLTLVVSLLGAVYASSRNTDAMLQESTVKLREADSDHLSRISTLEEAIRTIKADNAETKKDIKEILRILK